MQTNNNIQPGKRGVGSMRNYVRPTWTQKMSPEPELNFTFAGFT